MPKEPAATLIKRVAANVKARRYQLELTQDELAERMGLSSGYVRQVEAGKNLTIRSLVKLAHALQTSVIALFLPPPKAGTGSSNGDR